MLGYDTALAFKRAGHEVLACGRQELDITSAEQCNNIVSEYRPDVIINCAAFTKVDECETKQDFAFAVNQTGAGNLAKAAEKIGTYLVHISTDYVFDGSSKSPYKESDPVNPINIYGLSKLKGEEAVSESCSNFSILRTSWLFGLNGPNFIKTILNLAKEKNELQVVNDQQGCPTFTQDLAEAVLVAAEKRIQGIFHCTNSESCTWFDLARKAVSLIGKDPEMVKPVPTSAFPRPAKRPAYSVLDNSLFYKTTGVKLRPWQEATESYVSMIEK